MKILIMSHSAPPRVGGLESMLDVLSHGFAEAGHDVTVVTSQRSARFESIVPGRTLKVRPGFLTAHRLHRDADIVFHINLVARQYLHVVLSRRPWIVGVHTWIRRSDGRRSWRDRAKLQLLGTAKAIICASKALEMDVTGRTVTIPNCYQRDLFHQKDNGTRDATACVFVGRLVSDKGAELAVRAVAKLQGQGRRISLKIVGAGPELHRLTELVRACGLEGSVEFLGSLSRALTARVMRECAVVLVPSIWREPFGLVAIEAIASSARVVASDIGGLPEAVGPVGNLFEPGSLDALIRSLDASLGAGEYSQVEREAIHRHLQKHSPEVIVNRYLEVFDSCLRQVAGASLETRRARGRLVRSLGRHK